MKMNLDEALDKLHAAGAITESEIVRVGSTCRYNLEDYKRMISIRLDNAIDGIVERLVKERPMFFPDGEISVENEDELREHVRKYIKKHIGGLI